MAICEKAGETYKLNKIEPLKGDNKNVRYLSINPTGHIPMIEDGMFKVLGGNHIIFVFLCKSKANISQKLMPAELDLKIKGILGWHQAKMLVPGQQMFRILYEPSAFASPPSLASLNKWREDMLSCLKALDEKLVGDSFLCGNKMTIGDIVVFNELS